MSGGVIIVIQTQKIAVPSWKFMEGTCGIWYHVVMHRAIDR